MGEVGEKVGNLSTLVTVFVPYRPALPNRNGRGATHKSHIGHFKFSYTHILKNKNQ